MIRLGVRNRIEKLIVKKKVTDDKYSECSKFNKMMKIRETQEVIVTLKMQIYRTLNHEAYSKSNSKVSGKNKLINYYFKSTNLI